MRVVSSCGCEGGEGGKEGLVEAFVKWWGEEEEILMFGNGMWDCDAIYCNIQESLNVHKHSQKFQSGLFFTCFSTALTFADAEGRFAHITVDFHTRS